MVLILAIAKTGEVYFPTVIAPEESVKLLGANPKKWEMVEKHFPITNGVSKAQALARIEELKKERLNAGETVHPDILWMYVSRFNRTVVHLSESAA